MNIKALIKTLTPTAKFFQSVLDYIRILALCLILIVVAMVIAITIGAGISYIMTLIFGKSLSFTMGCIFALIFWIWRIIFDPLRDRYKKIKTKMEG